MVGIRFNAAVTAALLALEPTIILVVSALGFAHAHWSLAGMLNRPACVRRRWQRRLHQPADAAARSAA